MRTLVGRAPELASLEGDLGRVLQGQPMAVLVHGPAGVGKTALLREFAAALENAVVIWLSGDEAEQLIPMGVVDQLWRARGAVRPPEQADPFAAGAALLGLFGDTNRPVVLVLDDVQWADRASVQAIHFALRRLRTERVLAIFACREPAAAGLPDGLLRSLRAEPNHSLRLAGLDAAALVELSALHGAVLTGPRARQLHRQTEGNPLHAIELLAELDDLERTADGIGPMPAPRSTTEIVTDRLSATADSTRAVVEAVAVLGLHADRRLALQLAEKSFEGLVPEALDEAVTERFLVASDSRVAFPHPLVQATAYHAILPGRRRRLHLDAVELTTGDDRLRHRVAAADGADAALATEVAGYAAELVVRGDWMTAADLFHAAQRLAADPPTRDRYLLDRLGAYVLGGDATAIGLLLPLAEEMEPSAYRDFVLAQHRVTLGDRVGAMAYLESAWKLLPPQDEAFAARVAGTLAMETLNDGLAEDSLEWSARALALPSPPPMRGFTRALRALAFGEAGRIDDGLASVAEHAAVVSGPEELGALLGRGVLTLWSDRPAEAIPDLTTVERIAARSGPLYVRGLAMCYRSDASYRLGDWDAASTDAEAVASLAATAGNIVLSAMANAYAVAVAAGRGDWELAEARVKVAEESGAQIGDITSTAWASQAMARLAHARSDWDGILEILGAWWLFRELPGVMEPGLARWPDMYAEALVERERIPEALEVLTLGEEYAASRKNPSALQAMLRTRARAYAAADEPRDRVDAVFADALAIEVPGRGLDPALTALGYGSWLTRSGRAETAVEHLRRARALLVRLGARPYLQQCDAMLEVAGQSAESGDSGEPDLRSQLTTQEMAVCTLVVAGLTNKEVAAHLVVSVKTVEFHLGNVYRKAGVANRRELTRRLRA